jgi:integrase
MMRPGFASSDKRFLISAAYAPSTLTRYSNAVSSFLAWCRRVYPGFDPSTAAEFDILLTDYFHNLFVSQQGMGKGQAQMTFSGVLMHLPLLKQHLHLSSLSLRGWKRLIPAQPYPPLTWELSCAIAVRLCLDGHFLAGVGVLLAFDCFLRIGELLALRYEDVADAGDSRFVSVDMAVRLRHTKTGPNQLVVVQSPEVKHLVRYVLRGTAKGGCLFPYSSGVFRLRFKQACRSLGLSSSYVPHSLRHGGATRAHLRGVSLEDILQRGRWASTQSARRYVQAGRSLLLSVAVPPRVQALSISISKRLLQHLSLAQLH